jgi:DNA-binding transcriptional regulator GbsR (MarR family)
MNKLAYTIQTYKRVHECPLGNMQFSILVALAASQKGMTSQELREATSISNPASMITKISDYIIVEKSKKIDGRWTNYYKATPAGVKLVIDILS